MIRIAILTVLVATFALAACVDPPSDSTFELSSLAYLQPADYDEAEILTVLAEQMEAWNEGSIVGFMEGYARTESLRFASGGNARNGWQTTLESYQRGYPDTSTMGTLEFDDLDVNVLSDDHALVFGRWSLQRSHDQPNGLFTLIFQKRPEGWRIIHDHTSER